MGRIDAGGLKMPLFDTTEDLFGYSKKNGATKVPSKREILKVSGKYMLMKDAIGDLSDGKKSNFQVKLC